MNPARRSPSSADAAGDDAAAAAVVFKGSGASILVCDGPAQLQPQSPPAFLAGAGVAVALFARQAPRFDDLFSMSIRYTSYKLSRRFHRPAGGAAEGSSRCNDAIERVIGHGGRD